MSNYQKKKGGLGRTLLIMGITALAVLIYIISPIDLIPMLPFDDIAVGLGGFAVEAFTLAKAVKKK